MEKSDSRKVTSPSISWKTSNELSCNPTSDSTKSIFSPALASFYRFYDTFILNHSTYKQIDEALLINSIFSIYDNHAEYGLRSREGQTDMSLDIAEAYLSKTNLIAEAGVGIGKSFAYLIPALIINKHTNKPILIATSSIQLSEQLFSDINIISKKLGYQVTVAIGKGMGNYSCLSKALDIRSNLDYLERYKKIHWLIEGVANGEITERSDINKGITDSTWANVSVSNCKHERCFYKSSCSYYQMRTDISDASTDIQFIIVNQDLLIRDLILKHENGKGFIVSNPSMVIIDEAHNLEEKVRSALTETFTRKNTNVTMESIFSLFSSRYSDKELNNKLNQVKVIIEEFFDQLEKQIPQLILLAKSDRSERFSIDTPENTDYLLINKLIADMIISVSIYESRIKEREIDDALTKLNLLQKLFKIFQGSESNFLFWAEISPKKEMCINYCPKQIQNVLESRLFNMPFTTILTSATLCQTNSTNEIEAYDYITKSLGFKGERSSPKLSPFNYPKNTLMYISNDLPVYNYENRETYLDRALERIILLCNITHGRTLVLLSAKDDLNYLSVKLDRISTSWKKLFQREGSQQEAIINEFRESKGVLFGTGVFWEGINIEGDDLSQVIIVRLPFPVPSDPIIDYKVKNSNNSFEEVYLPEMLIRLRQGTGRLIRSETDRGLLSILDSRLSVKNNRDYRDSVINSLPFTNSTESLDTVKNFCNENLKYLSLSRTDITISSKTDCCNYNPDEDVASSKK
jgi:Rad3-related DNA helicases